MTKRINIHIVIIILCCISNNLFSQNVYATFAGLMEGIISKEQFLNTDSILLLGDNKAKIISYEINFKYEGHASKKILIKSAKLPDSIKQKFKELGAYKVFFEKISVQYHNKSINYVPIISINFHKLFVEASEPTTNIVNPARAVICDKFEGKRLYCNKITIQNNVDSLKIIEYSVYGYPFNGFTPIETIKSDSITSNITKLINKCRPFCTRFYFENILAINPKTKIIYRLNPIGFSCY